MEMTDDLMNIIERPSAKTKTKTKRKWREIEAIKDKYKLKQELLDIDWNLSLASDDLEL
ncbi:DUF3545 family protein [Flocculibacter collagenilyticus]|uniref:DUF3545 family protein n=1 Tax=Flocculibacter collagenilyticus TaxID=2744479 RepID=UPI0018F6EF09|nr:DUF3545 family protein [Flocculibacter collagenilyticus]